MTEHSQAKRTSAGPRGHAYSAPGMRLTAIKSVTLQTQYRFSRPNFIPLRSDAEGYCSTKPLWQASSESIRGVNVAGVSAAWTKSPVRACDRRFADIRRRRASARGFYSRRRFRESSSVAWPALPCQTNRRKLAAVESRLAIGVGARGLARLDIEAAYAVADATWSQTPHSTIGQIAHH